MKKFFKICINLILLLILIYSGFNIYIKLSSYKKADEVYAKIKSDYKNSKSSSNDEDSLPNKIKSLSEVNPDFKFWIKINNTNVDYPVVQTNNNDHYLKYDFYNNQNISGCIFMDYRVNTASQNIILYGHNMRNKTMFNNILKFKNPSFFDENNKIVITKDNKNYVYEVFSVYTTESKDDYLITNFNNFNDFEKYLNTIQSKSLFKSNINVNASDKLLTLSTCSYEFDDARTVIHAKLIN